MYKLKCTLYCVANCFANRAHDSPTDRRIALGVDFGRGLLRSNHTLLQYLIREYYYNL